MLKVNIDRLNIFLILFSGIFAFALPFHTFIIVYAFLGPLHYATEINWLQQRNYFLQNSTNVYQIFIPILLIGSIVYVPKLEELKPFIPFLIFFTLLVAIFNTKENIKLYKNWKFIVCVIAGIIIFLLSLQGTKQSNYFHTFFSIFLPTLIHVFIFTGIFMLTGFLKTKNKLSRTTFIVFIIVSLCMISFNLNSTFIMEDIANKYDSFEKLNTTIFSVFNKEILASQDIYFSNFGIRTMQLIAFAYTYHYLNWFSKTSIIQWHKTTKTKIYLILLIWILSVLLYLYNYRTGLYWLYLLSLTHVILEFPLNIISIKELFQNKISQ